MPLHSEPAGEESKRDWHPRGRIAVLADDRLWAKQAMELSREVGGAPERFAWSEAGMIEMPVRAILVLRDRSDSGQTSATLASWAATGWQPLAIVTDRPAPGSHGFAERIRELGYDAPLHHPAPGDDTEGYWREFLQCLRDRFERRLWLVPHFVSELGQADPWCARALEVLARNPRTRTVEDWARLTGLSGRRALEREFAERALPPPKRLLVRFRLAQAICERYETGSTLDAVARALAYPSGDYLGRRCRQLTGLPFSQAAASGLPLVPHR